MTATTEPVDRLLRWAARRLQGQERRLFQAEVADPLCPVSPRAAASRFGWGRDRLATGQLEARTGLGWVDHFPARGQAATVKRLHGTDPEGVPLSRSPRKPDEKRRKRCQSLPKDDSTSAPPQSVRQVG
jgi:hypothetical protein